jgi:general secretion pathway protein L
VVSIDDQEARLLLSEAGQDDEVGRLELTSADDQEALVSGLLRAYQGQIAEIVVRLPMHRVLRRTLSLPTTVEENLGAVLGFEMDRYTPFKVDQVYYDFAVRGRGVDGQTLTVVLTAVPRRTLDDLLARLGRWGLEPSVVDVADPEPASPPVNLLPADYRRRTATKGSRLQQLLALITLGLAVAVVAIPLVQKDRAVEALRAELARASEAAQAAQSLQKDYDRAVAEMTFVVRKRYETPAAIDVLDELTRVLPDETWLSRFELSGSELRIQGESNAASALISVVEQSALFRDARFTAPVTQNARTGLERFAIAARIGRESAP